MCSESWNWSNITLRHSVAISGCKSRNLAYTAAGILTSISTLRSPRRILMQEATSLLSSESPSPKVAFSHISRFSRNAFTKVAEGLTLPAVTPPEAMGVPSQ